MITIFLLRQDSVVEYIQYGNTILYSSNFTPTKFREIFIRVPVNMRQLLNYRYTYRLMTRKKVCGYASNPINFLIFKKKSLLHRHRLPHFLLELVLWNGALLKLELLTKIQAGRKLLYRL